MGANRLFIYSAFALAIGSILHVAAVFMGAKTVKFLGAPPPIVRSFEDGTFYGPVITLAIAGLLAGLALMAFKAQSTTRPILRFVLWVFAGIFTLRGLLIFLFVPAIMAGRDGGNPRLFWFHVGASIFVLALGLALGLALHKSRKVT